MMNDDTLVSIAFPLKVVDNYPPMNEITLPARPIEDDRFVISAIPFFVNDLAYGDVISASPSDRGALTFERVLERSTHKTVQVTLRHKSYLRYLVEFLERQKLSWDAQKGNVYFAIACASQDQYEELTSFLEIAYEKDHLDYMTSRA